MMSVSDRWLRSWGTRPGLSWILSCFLSCLTSALWAGLGGWLWYEASQSGVGEQDEAGYVLPL